MMAALYAPARLAYLTMLPILLTPPVGVGGFLLQIESLQRGIKLPQQEVYAIFKSERKNNWQRHKESPNYETHPKHDAGNLRRLRDILDFADLAERTHALEDKPARQG